MVLTDPCVPLAGMPFRNASMTDTTSNTRNTSNTETILFGAFDRHNFGDHLCPHIVARMLPDRSLRFAGRAESDLLQRERSRPGARGLAQQANSLCRYVGRGGYAERSRRRRDNARHRCRSPDRARSANARCQDARQHLPRWFPIPFSVVGVMSQAATAGANGACRRVPTRAPAPPRR